MDPPPLPLPLPTTTTPTPPPPPDSTPLSPTTTTTPPPPSPKLRFMCSYNGHIIPRPHDKSLCYIGGETRIIVIDRNTSLSDLQTRLSKSIFKSKPFTLKYQLPNEDLDSLITISTNDDLENMVDEYDRLEACSKLNKNSKTTRLRLFLFNDNKTQSSISSIESLLESSTKSEDWFLEALNGISIGNNNRSIYSESNSSVNCLLGLDQPVPRQQIRQEEQEEMIGNGGGMVRDLSEESLIGKENNNININNNRNNFQDANSVPDSPMVDNTSSFGSGSSMPSMANLPPIRVHVEGGLVAGSSPPAPVVMMGGGGGGGGGGDYVNRVISDDERSDQGVPVGYRKVPQFQHQVQVQQQQQPAQFQQKPAGFFEMPSPDSVSSDGSIANPLSRQRQMVYQEQMMHMQSGNNRVGGNVIVVDQKINDPNNRGQMQQPGQESEYVIPSGYEPHPQLHQQQQFVHGGVHYIRPHTAGGVPIASYYPMYQSQQQHHPHHQGSEQQFVYYMPPGTRPAQTYNMPVQQQNFGESPKAARPQTPPHPTSLVNPAPAYNAMNAPASKPEMAAGAPQLLQVQSGQHHPQYVGYQMHHPSQSIRPFSGASANYAYDYAEPTHAQMYYTQPMTPQMTGQYQTVTSSPMVMLPGNSSQVATENNIKQQNNNSQL